MEKDKNVIFDIRVEEFSYGETPQLKDINLQIEKGEFILITGLSGCGKTTLLRILNGLIPDFYEGKLKGDVRLYGKSITDYEKGELAKYIGNVFQNPKDQFFSTIAEDEVALVGENLGMERETLKRKVYESMKNMGIENLKECSVFELSGGQRQKVAIASSLVYDTDIILLDEPSASLDYFSINELRKVLKELKENGKTIIVVDHRLYYLKDIFDRLVYMKDCTIGNIYKSSEINEEIRKENSLRCLDEKNLKGEKPNLSEIDIKKKKPDSIYVKGISVKAGKKMLIPELTFSVQEGECMGVIGTNGIGKTTLARELCGLIKLPKGETGYAGNKKGRLKSCYFVLQDPDSQLFAHTVEHEIIPKERMADEEYLKRAKEYLRRADLWEKRKEHPQELSTGEKQRLVLVTAFLSDRRFLILDEPSSGLDYKRMNLSAELIAEKSENTPIILITHDSELLFKTCNTVLMINKKGYRKIDVKGNEKEIMGFLHSNC